MGLSAHIWLTIWTQGAYEWQLIGQAVSKHQVDQSR